MHIQTTVQFPPRKLEDLRRAEVTTKLVSIHVMVDPVTGREEVSIYDDDGRGNGNLILRFETN